MTHPRVSFLTSLGLSLLIHSWAGGAVVVLNNGDQIEGEITSRNELSVTVQTMTNELTLPMSRVSEIKEGGPGSSNLYRARELITRGDLDGAKAQCEEAMTAGADKESVDKLLIEVREKILAREMAKFQTLLNRAREAAARGEDSDALQQIRVLIDQLDKDNPIRDEMIKVVCDYHQKAASQLRDRVQNDRAVIELGKVIELDPARAEAYAEIGDIYKTSSAKWDAAVENYRTAINLAGDQLDAKRVGAIYWEIAEIFRQKSQWKDASINYLSAYEKDHEANARIIDRLQDSFTRYARDLEASNPKVALEVVERALAIRMKPDLMELRGELLSKVGEREDDDTYYDKSNQQFEELLKLDPNRRNVNFLMSQNHSAKGELLQARERLEREIAINPKHYAALCDLADYALETDNFDAAEDYFVRARAIDEDNPRASLGLGRAYREENKLDEAVAIVQGVLARLPESREANLEMGQILRAKGDLPKATEFFTQVLDLIDKASPQEQFNLRTLKADAYLARGDIRLTTAGPGTADADFQNALAALPNYGRAYFNIGRAYRNKFAKSKNNEDLKVAEQNLLKARELEPENARFALEIGILYAEELAAVEPENAEKYRREAKQHWEAYIQLGGANQQQVKDWISQLGLHTAQS